MERDERVEIHEETRFRGIFTPQLASSHCESLHIERFQASFVTNTLFLLFTTAHDLHVDAAKCAYRCLLITRFMYNVQKGGLRLKTVVRYTNYCRMSVQCLFVV